MSLRRILFFCLWKIIFSVTQYKRGRVASCLKKPQGYFLPFSPVLLKGQKQNIIFWCSLRFDLSRYLVILKMDFSLPEIVFVSLNECPCRWTFARWSFLSLCMSCVCVSVCVCVWVCVCVCVCVCVWVWVWVYVFERVEVSFSGMLWTFLSFL